MAGRGETSSISSRSTRTLISALWFVWAGYTLVYLFAPFRSVRGFSFSIPYTLFFVLLTTLVAVFLSKKMPLAERLETSRLPMFDERRVQIVLFVTVGLSLVGLVLHFYDKIVLRNFDYTGCLDTVREAWVKRKSRGIYSWQSASGHVLTHMTFASLLLAVQFENYIRRRWFYLTLILSAATIFLYAYSLGGRSPLVLYLVFAAGCFLLPYIFSQKRSIHLWNFLLVLAVSMAIYAFAILHSRIVCVGFSDKPTYYVAEYFRELGIEVDDGVVRSPPSDTDKYPGFFITSQLNQLVEKTRKHLRWSELVSGHGKNIKYSTLAVVFMYLNNGMWNFEQVLDANKIRGRALSNFLFAWGSKLGMWEMPASGARPFGYGMISLPGAALFEFGWLGFVLASVILGVLIWLAGRLLARVQSYALGLLLFTTLFIVICLAPLSFAINLMSFPFIGVACLMAVLSIRWAKKRPEPLL